MEIKETDRFIAIVNFNHNWSLKQINNKRTNKNQPKFKVKMKKYKLKIISVSVK